MANASDRALLDANILVYAASEDAPQHAACADLLERARSGEVAVCLAVQVLYEYFAVMTNPKLVNPVLTVEEALRDLSAYAALFPIIPAPEQPLEQVTALVREVRPTRAQVFDVVLAATMLANGVHRIYTFNTKHFDKTPGIRSLSP